VQTLPPAAAAVIFWIQLELFVCNSAEEQELESEPDPLGFSFPESEPDPLGFSFPELDPEDEQSPSCEEYAAVADSMALENALLTDAGQPASRLSIHFVYVV